MIRLALYAYGFWWVLNKMGYTVTKAKPVQGFGEAHDPLEHPMGELNCTGCPRHPMR